LKVYLDQTDIRSGSLSRELNGALSDARALVVCCSPAARTSAWVGREIDAFMGAEEDRRVAAVLLSGTPEQAMPARLEELELRVHDLRRGWWFGLLRRKARDELLRLVALIADVPLRDLIPWDKRLRRQRALTSACVMLALVGAVLVYPVQTWEYVNVALEKLRPGPRTILGAEVVDGSVVLLTRYEHCRDGGCVFHTSIDSVTENGVVTNVPYATYRPRHHLVHARVAPAGVLAHTRAAFHLTDQNMWIAEPVPNDLIAIRPLHPPWQTPDDDTPWPAGQSEVLIHRGNRTESAEVEGLYAEWEPKSQPQFYGEPALPSAGFSIAWGADEIWLGSSTGLWRTVNGGKTWEQQHEFSSVTSVFLDPDGGDRHVLVSEMAPVASLGGPPAPREVRLVERRAGQKEWGAFSAPPFGSHSEVEFCGVLRDGNLIIRVDTRLYRQQRLPMYRRLLEAPLHP